MILPAGRQGGAMASAPAHETTPRVRRDRPIGPLVGRAVR
jgi:hypothetical protein